MNETWGTESKRMQLSAAGTAAGATSTQADNATAVAVMPIRLSIWRRIILCEVIVAFSLIARKGERYVR
jgi:hypothetical protein